MAGLKKRLDDAKGKWVDELPHVLWTYHTTPQRSTGETHFSMTYGLEVVIPLEFGFLTLRMDQSFTPRQPGSGQEKTRDSNGKDGFLPKKTKQRYDRGAKSRPLAPRDLVLRKVVGMAKNPAWGKLGLN